MSTQINIMERFAQIVQELKALGLYVDSKLEINDQTVQLKIEANNIPR